MELSGGRVTKISYTNRLKGQKEPPVFPSQKRLVPFALYLKLSGGRIQQSPGCLIIRGFRKLGILRGRRRGIHRDEISILPLEQVGQRLAIHSMEIGGKFCR